VAQVVIRKSVTDTRECAGGNGAAGENSTGKVADHGNGTRKVQIYEGLESTHIYTLALSNKFRYLLLSRSAGAVSYGNLSGRRPLGQ
jgi:hypothetical protein